MQYMYMYIPAGIPTPKHLPPDSELRKRDNRGRVKRVTGGGGGGGWREEGRRNHLTSILIAVNHSRREVVSSQYH